MQLAKVLYRCVGRYLLTILNQVLVVFPLQCASRPAQLCSVLLGQFIIQRMQLKN